MKGKDLNKRLRELREKNSYTIRWSSTAEKERVRSPEWFYIMPNGNKIKANRVSFIK